MDWYETAKSAYATYVESTGFNDSLVRPMPEFDSLPHVIKNAWMSASKEVAECIDRDKSKQENQSKQEEDK